MGQWLPPASLSALGDKGSFLPTGSTRFHLSHEFMDNISVKQLLTLDFLLQSSSPHLGMKHRASTYMSKCACGESRARGEPGPPGGGRESTRIHLQASPKTCQHLC